MTRLLLVVSCCLSLWVSGCSDTSSSTTDPPPTTPTSASPTSSPTPRQETPEEFVRRWVEVSNRMQNTGDTAEYRQLSRSCRPCLAVADQVSGYFAKGGYVKTQGWIVKGIRLSDPSHHARILATVRVDSMPTEYKETSGSTVRHLTGGRLIALLTLRASGASWVVANVEQQAQ